MTLRAFPHNLFAPAFEISQLTKVENQFSEKWLGQHEVPEEPLFHYTTAQGMRGILGERRLWLSDITSFNDPGEIEYGKRGGTASLLSRDQLQFYLDEFVFRHNRRRQPMAAFQTLLGLGTGRTPTSYELIRGAKDIPTRISARPCAIPMSAMNRHGRRRKRSVILWSENAAAGRLNPRTAVAGFWRELSHWERVGERGRGKASP